MSRRKISKEKYQEICRLQSKRQKERKEKSDIILFFKNEGWEIKDTTFFTCRKTMVTDKSGHPLVNLDYSNRLLLDDKPVIHSFSLNVHRTNIFCQCVSFMECLETIRNNVEKTVYRPPLDEEEKSLILLEIDSVIAGYRMYSVHER